MRLIESPKRFFYHLEAIDIENNEYLFWDSTGAGVSVSVAHDKIKQITHCDQVMSLPEAFQTYAQSYSLQFTPEGSPIDIWTSLQSQIPPRRTLWSRLFGKSKT